MGTDAGSDQTVVSSIAALRRDWLASIKASDTERLLGMVTDDIVVVHGDGRCVCGREELKADFRKGFEAFSIDQNVVSAQVVVRGPWAFDIAEVDTKLTPHTGGAPPLRFHSASVVALRRQPDGSWKIARVLGLLGPPAAS